MKILQTYKDTLPACRFIGKKYQDKDRNAYGTYGHIWGQWFAEGLFVPLEKLTLNTPDGGSFIGLMTTKPDCAYWIGVFCPPDTAVPEGYSYIDYNQMPLSVSWLYGKEETGELYSMQACNASSAATKANGWTPCGIVFERYNCPRFTQPDKDGNVILDLCFQIKK